MDLLDTYKKTIWSLVSLHQKKDGIDAEFSDTIKRRRNAIGFVSSLRVDCPLFLHCSKLRYHCLYKLTGKHDVIRRNRDGR